MKYIVLWFFVLSIPTGYHLEEKRNEFGKYIRTEFVKEYRHDSTQYARAFETKREAEDFVKKMKKQCEECVFVKLDSIKYENKE